MLQPRSDQQVAEISSWRARATDSIEQQVAREEAIDLARNIVAAEARLKQNKTQLADLNDQLAPGLQAQPGLGPVTTGTILSAYSHHGRNRSEAAFASLAGVAPLQASSGNTTRHRLNRHGDRQLNMALDVVIKSRMRFDETTKKYVERRTTEGLSYREIKRILKRYRLGGHGPRFRIELTAGGLLIVGSLRQRRRRRHRACRGVRSYHPGAVEHVRLR